MSDNGERKLIDAINYHLTCGPLYWNLISIRSDKGFIKFKLMKNDTIELKIELFYSEKNTLRTVVWQRDVEDDNGDWDFPIYDEHTVPVPTSEEEYFQYSTVYDLVYSLNFFKYIKSVLTDNTTQFN